MTEQEKIIEQSTKRARVSGNRRNLPFSAELLCWSLYLLRGRSGSRGRATILSVHPSLLAGIGNVSYFVKVWDFDAFSLKLCSSVFQLPRVRFPGCGAPRLRWVREKHFLQRSASYVHVRVCFWTEKRMVEWSERVVPQRTSKQARLKKAFFSLLFLPVLVSHLTYVVSSSFKAIKMILCIMFSVPTSRHGSRSSMEPCLLMGQQATNSGETRGRQREEEKHKKPCSVAA